MFQAPWRVHDEKKRWSETIIWCEGRYATVHVEKKTSNSSDELMRGIVSTTKDNGDVKRLQMTLSVFTRRGFRIGGYDSAVGGRDS